MHHRRSPPPPTCVTGLVDFEYTLLLSHCCEDILGSGHLLQGHVSHVSIAEFYPCSPFYYYAHFFSSTSMSFYLLAMLSNGRPFFFYILLWIWVLTHFFPMSLDTILFKLLKNFTFSVYFVHTNLWSFWNFQQKFAFIQLPV